MARSSDSWSVMEHSKTPSQHTAFSMDSKYLSFGAMLLVWWGEGAL